MTKGLDLLEELVSIDSGPGQAEGITAVQNSIGSRLSGLGYDVHLEPTRGDLNVLLARRTVLGTPRVLLLGHADTVFKVGTASARPFTVTGDLCTGPGVADMKGGLLVMLEALESIRDLPVSITVIVNGDEESGSINSRCLIETEARGQDVALVFEPARPSGAYVIGRRGVQRYLVEVTGRAAHTGVDPQAGANAVEAAAYHAIRLQTFGRKVDKATVTVALISGGSRPNVVPELATLTVDSRLDDETAAETVASEMASLMTEPPVVEGTTTRVEPLDARPPMIPASGLERFCEMYEDSAVKAGFKTSPVSTGGSSDGNFTASLGLPTLDGLGPVGGGYHTDEEFVRTATLASRAKAAAGLLLRLTQARLR